MKAGVCNRQHPGHRCCLTAKAKGHRTVFYAGSGTDAPGCALRRFGDPFTNWHYQCARAFVEGKLHKQSGQLEVR